MENEMMDNEMPSYWSSVFIAASIVALITAVMNIVAQYMTIGGEPTGSAFNASQLVGIVSCLVAALGGFIATRHYATTNDVKFPMGKGALIGLFTGIFLVLISTVISLIWTYLIDPDLNQAFYDWQIANVEAQNVPDQQKEMAISFIPEPGSTSALMIAVGIGLVVTSILNVISGLIGAKIFAKEEE